MARARKPLHGQSTMSSRGGMAPAGSGELPHSTEAEISVLGSAILNNETVDVLIPLVGPDDFASSAHARIFESILALHDDQRAIDIVTLRDELQRVGNLEAVGGVAYLSGLLEAVPAAANAEHYAQIVREKAISRNLLTAAREISESVLRGGLKSRELLDEAQSRIFTIAERGTNPTMAPIKDILKTTFARIEQAKGRDGMITGLATGFVDLDEKLSGLQKGELIIIAGRPSMGKSTLALNVMTNVGVQLQQPAAIFSLEMSREQVAQNMLCAHARLDSHRLRRGRLSSKELNDLPLHVGALSEAPIFIDDSPSLNCFELRAKARRLKSQHGLQLVIVDYVQLLQSSGADSREQEIAAISRNLKALAREMNIPIIAVAQLNRQAEARDNHRPRMADLRESGSLEQDADVILLLHRASYYSDADSEDRSADLIIAKQRNGPTGIVNLTFLKEHMRFESSIQGAQDFQ